MTACDCAWDGGGPGGGRWWRWEELELGREATCRRAGRGHSPSADVHARLVRSIDSSLIRYCALFPFVLVCGSQDADKAEENASFSGVDAIVILVGDPDEDGLYKKSTALQVRTQIHLHSLGTLMRLVCRGGVQVWVSWPTAGVERGRTYAGAHACLHAHHSRSGPCVAAEDQGASVRFDRSPRSGRSPSPPSMDTLELALVRVRVPELTFASLGRACRHGCSDTSSRPP